MFGKTSGIAVDLSDIAAGNGGFVIEGIDADDLSGNSISSAGDVNNDGYDDLIVGAVGGDPNGEDSGESYIIYGGDFTVANVAPTAEDDDAGSTDEDTVFSIAAPGLLANDSDGDGGTLAVKLADTASALGAVVNVNADGSFDYDPTGVVALQLLQTGESATDSFTYTLSDGYGGTDTATVAVTISGIGDLPVAVGDSGLVNENGPAITIDVLLNDSDAEGDPLSVAGIDTVLTTGSVTNNGDGTFTYDPNGQFDGLGIGESAADTFTYTVADGTGGTDTATVTVTIAGINDAPDARDDTLATDENSVLAASVFTDNGDGVDNDPNGDTFAVTLVDGQVITMAGSPVPGVETPNTIVLASGATVEMLTDGTFDYNPGAVFDGLTNGQTATDTFTYTLADAFGLTDTATVTVTINGVSDTSMAVDDDVTGVSEDGISLDLGPVLANDDSSPLGGTLTVLRVEGQPITIFGPDPDDPTMETDLPNPITLASGSVVTMRADGTFDFTPGDQFNALNTGETASDVFTYTMDDGLGGTDTATVTVTIDGVTDTANAQDDAIAVSENGSLNLGPVLANDDANPLGGANSVVMVEGQAITIFAPNPDPGDPGAPDIEIPSPITLASGSVVTMRPDGTFDFTPGDQFNSLNAGETATDVFTYTIDDDLGGTDTATVTVTINGVTDTANAMDDIVTVSEDGSLNLGPVLANDDANPLGGVLNVILVDGQSLPIRLTPMTATCRVPPLSRVKLGIGWSRGVARDAEQ